MEYGSNFIIDFLNYSLIYSSTYYTVLENLVPCFVLSASKL